MTLETSVDYNAVLVDLRAKRDQINAAILAIEAIVGVGGGPASSPSASTAQQIEPGMFLGMTIADATKKLLSMRRKPMRTEEIMSALRSGGVAFTSENPLNTVGSVLNRAYTSNNGIVRVDRGLWGISEWYPHLRRKAENGKHNTSSQSEAQEKIEQDEREQIDQTLQDLIGEEDDSNL